MNFNHPQSVREIESCGSTLYALVTLSVTIVGYAGSLVRHSANGDTELHYQKGLQPSQSFKRIWKYLGSGTAQSRQSPGLVVWDFVENRTIQLTRTSSSGASLLRWQRGFL